MARNEEDADRLLSITPSFRAVRLSIQNLLLLSDVIILVMAKTKILYLITKSNWGGAQSYVYDLATHLPQDKFEVMVAAGAPNEGEMGMGRLVSKLLAADIPFHKFKHSARDINPFREILLAYELWQLYRKEKPDVIHVNSSKLGGLGATIGRLIGIKKIIFTAHGWPFNERHRSFLWRAVVHFLSWLTSMFAHVTITITDDNLAQGRAFPICGGKVFKVPLGIKEFPKLPREEAREIIAKKVNKQACILRRDTIWIGTIGELTANKGHAYLLDAANKLQEQFPTIQFVIIGDGEDKVKLHNKRERLKLAGRVLFTGFMDDASQYLKAFDIFVLPSLKEGLPYTILQAAQASLPVAASHVGGIPDLLGQDGKSGILTKAASTESLCQGLASILEQPEQMPKMGQSLTRRIEEHFSFDSMLKQTTALYLGKSVPNKY